MNKNKYQGTISEWGKREIIAITKDVDGYVTYTYHIEGASGNGQHSNNPESDDFIDLDLGMDKVGDILPAWVETQAGRVYSFIEELNCWLPKNFEIDPFYSLQSSRVNRDLIDFMLHFDKEHFIELQTVHNKVRWVIFPADELI